jgi:hypothetical protein
LGKGKINVKGAAPLARGNTECDYASFTNPFDFFNNIMGNIMGKILFLFNPGPKKYEWFNN